MAALSQSGLVIRIPNESRLYPLSELPATRRLSNIFAKLGLRTIADLTSDNLDRIIGAPGFGKISLDDLINLVERVEAGEFCRVKVTVIDQVEFADILSTIDCAILELSDSYREIISLRYGDSGNTPFSLSDLASHFGCTGQAISFKEQSTREHLRKGVGSAYLDQLRFLAQFCVEEVVPLDPNLFAYFIQRSGLPDSVSGEYIRNAAYYLRILQRLVPELPVWPMGPEPYVWQSRRWRDALLTARNLLKDGSVSLKKLYDAIAKLSLSPTGSVTDFLDAARHSPYLRIHYRDSPRSPLSQRFIVTAEPEALPRPPVLSKVYEILNASPKPLRIEEINALLRKQGDGRIFYARSSQDRRRMEDFQVYMLGPKSFGASRHFRMTSEQSFHAADAAYSILSQSGLPASVRDLVSVPEMLSIVDANPYELAYLLRSDARFVNLNRLNFGLAKWGLTSLPSVSELLVSTLRESKRPLSFDEILNHMRKSRPVSDLSVGNFLAANKAIVKHGKRGQRTFSLR